MQFSLRRYPLATSVLFGGLLLSMLCLFHASSLSRALLLEKMDADNSFPYTYSVSVSNIDSCTTELFDYLESCSGNITIPSVDLYVGSNNTLRLCNVILSQSEQPKEVLVDGYYPVSNRQKNCIILGECMKNSATVSEGGTSCCTINGEACMVTGYIRSPYSANRSYDVNIYLSSCSDSLQSSIMQSLCSFGFNIMFETSDYLVYKSYAGYADDIRELLDGSATITSSDISSSDVRFYASETYESEERTAYLSFIYSFILIIISADFYVLCRRRELIIRKIFGYSVRQLIIVLIMDIMKVCSFSIIAALMIEYLLSQLSGSIFHINKYAVAIQIIAVFAFICILTIVLALYISGRLKKYSVYEYLNKKE